MVKVQKGFTLIELLIVMAVIFVIVIFFGVLLYGTLLKGNFWYTEDGVLKALQFEHPQVEKVLKTTRNLWDYSEIIVQEGGERKTYYLDTNILGNYEFPPNQDN